MLPAHILLPQVGHHQTTEMQVDPNDHESLNALLYCELNSSPRAGLET